MHYLPCPDKQTVIKMLKLEPHLEGGYFRRTFQADHRDKLDLPIGERFCLTSIFYMLTAEANIGRWHCNCSDIIHYFHMGAPINYFMLHPDGSLQTVTLGPDLAKGQQLQLIVKGGVWKASHLPAGGYGLISEAVAPGFDYNDMTLAKQAQLSEQFPEHQAFIKAYTRN